MLKQVDSKDREKIIKETLLNGVSNFIIAGYNIKGSKKAIEIAKNYEQIYTTVGISPNDVKDNVHESILQIEEIARNRHFISKGGEVDYERVALTVLDDFKKSRLGRITLL